MSLASPANLWGSFVSVRKRSSSRIVPLQKQTASNAIKCKEPGSDVTLAGSVSSPFGSLHQRRLAERLNFRQNFRYDNVTNQDTYGIRPLFPNNPQNTKWRVINAFSDVKEDRQSDMQTEDIRKAICSAAHVCESPPFRSTRLYTHVTYVRGSFLRRFRSRRFP